MIKMTFQENDLAAPRLSSYNYAVANGIRRPRSRRIRRTKS